MSEFVRVSLPNGHEATLSAAFVEGTDLQVLDVPATNSRGVPLAATRKGGRRMKRSTTVEKEAARKRAARKSDPGPSDTPTNDGVAVETPEEAL